MKMDLAGLRHYAPYLAPFAIVGLGWMLLVRPTSAQNTRAAQELDELRRRVATVRTQNGVPLPPPEPAVDPAMAFERLVAAGDASGRVLEELSRLASATRVRIDMLETGEQGDVNAGTGPGVAGAAIPDPRLALFQAPLKYSPVTLTADADYSSLGEFLWRLRDLATLIEIRALDITAPAAQPDEAPETPGTLRVTLTLFAYARTGARAAGDPGFGFSDQQPVRLVPAASSPTPDERGAE
jgi:hypothetical protein